jgi:xylan 1,4-beta-xylosidase
MQNIYTNPILPGFYPDPSICRVEEDYFLVTSSFEYFPGLPIFHSHDLVHWHQIGHVLDRPSQLPLDGIRPSGGLYAPTIRYYQGVFYVVNTLVDGKEKKGNFIVTASDPSGPWSEPYWLEDAPGIDPSLFFDDDGMAWYCGNREPNKGDTYKGHREIWLQELDLTNLVLKGPKYTLWDGAFKGSIHAEAPHIYKINHMYYLMIAEGGTGHNHAVTITRSGNITGPYDTNQRNPILTHRHLGLDYPIVGTGHADIVETQNGEWWMFMLAMRPYGGYYYNLGRETFLAPMKWEDGWPIVAPSVGKVVFQGVAPNLPEHRWQTEPTCDNFESTILNYYWNFIRTPRDAFWSLVNRPGYLRILLRPEKLTERANPSFVGRRQQHTNFTINTVMDFTPKNKYECAGVALIQNDGFHYRFVITLGEDNKLVVKLIQCKSWEDILITQQAISGSRFYLKVESYGQSYNFYIASHPEDWNPIAVGIDGRILSTPVAGGFTGTYLGMYASGNGQLSNNYADYDWFEYRGI